MILADCQSVRQILSNRCCPSRRGARSATSGEAAERHHRRGRTSNRSDGGGGQSANENREGDENEMVKMAERVGRNADGGLNAKMPLGQLAQD